MYFLQFRDARKFIIKYRIRANMALEELAARKIKRQKRRPYRFRLHARHDPEYISFKLADRDDENGRYVYTEHKDGIPVGKIIIAANPRNGKAMVVDSYLFNRDLLKDLNIQEKKKVTKKDKKWQGRDQNKKLRS